MAETAAAHREEAGSGSVWSGGESPFAVAWPKLMMWLFLLSDALTFAALLSAYGAMRLTSEVWPNQREFFNLGLVGSMTFILICSSATMAVAVGAARRGDRPTLLRFLGLTILGGALFLGMQAYEWTHFIGEGARLTGFVGEHAGGIPAMFSATFFVTTGFHGFHVTSGVVYLIIMALRAARGRFSAEGIEVTGLYWHFVDLVWVFIFTLLYLI